LASEICRAPGFSPARGIFGKICLVAAFAAFFAAAATTVATATATATTTVAATTTTATVTAAATATPPTATTTIAAATTTTAATTIPTAAAATTTIAAAATATVSATTTLRAFFPRASDVDVDGATVEVLAIEPIDRGLRLFIRAHGHKRESARAARRFVGHEEGIGNGAELGKSVHEDAFGGLERKVPDE